MTRNANPESPVLDQVVEATTSRPPAELRVIRAAAPVVVAGGTALIAYLLMLNVVVTLLLPVGVLALYGLAVIYYDLRAIKNELRHVSRRLSPYIRRAEKNAAKAALSTTGIDGPPKGLEVYLAYRTLEVQHFAAVLRSVSQLYHEIYAVAEPDWQSNTPFASVNVDSLLRGRPEDRLIIHSIQTGDSIVLKCCAGWAPKVVQDKKDIVIFVPKGSVVLYFIATLLGSAVAFGTSQYNAVLDAQAKTLELECKRLEGDKIRLEIEELRRRLTEAPPPAQERIQDALDQFVRLTAAHDEITRVTVRPLH